MKHHEKYLDKYELCIDGKTYIRKGYTKVCVFCFFLLAELIVLLFLMVF